MLNAVGWAVIGLSSLAAVALGVRWHRPLRAAPWWLLGAAIAAMTVGDISFALHLPVLADPSYLAMFPLVTVSLVQLTRGGVLGDRTRLIDVLAFICAALLLVWVFLIGRTPDLAAISPSDAIGDLLLVVCAIRLLVAAGRNASAMLLVAGSVGLLGSDIAYPLVPGHRAEIGYALLYVSWGAAALHPSMTRLTTQVPPRPRPWRGRWAAMLGFSVATPPAVLLIEAMRGDVRDGVVIAIASGVTLVLAITRLGDSLEQHSRALDRERGLRAASAALVAAADVSDVDVAVRAAILGLLPAGLAHRVEFAAGTPWSAGTTTVPGDGVSPARSWWQDGSTSDGAASMTPAALICPLWLEPQAVPDSRDGMLIVHGRRDALVATRDAIEVLAGHAALAIDRISLVAAVARRDSDDYLRAVIRNSIDVMLIADGAYRIRYATPALATLLGAELPPFAMLRDVIDPEDHRMVERTLAGDALLDSGQPTGVVFCTVRRPDGGQVPVEMAYRDMRHDRLVAGFVVTLRDLTGIGPSHEPRRDSLEDIPAGVNRRSVRHKFRL